MALGADRHIQSKGEDKPRYCPVIASDIIYKGALCSFQSGYVGPVTGDQAFAGVAMEQVDNSSGSAGDLSVLLWTAGLFLLTGSTVTQAWVGQDVFATADDTIALSGTGAYVGVVKQYYSTTQCWVEITTQDYA
jgi:hypothetical protein